MTILNGYQPAHVVRYFEEICAIPHPSHHEQALCAYIRGCAERYGHRYVEDAAGNLMVYLNATPGYEDKAPMLLQAHMDMVSAKEPGSNHNFLTDPIRLHIEDGHYLYADDTTLGADNAVGLVNMLALMEDDTVVHPPMELLFTVCEEDGMEGIRQRMTPAGARIQLPKTLSEALGLAEKSGFVKNVLTEEFLQAYISAVMEK